VQRQHRLFFFFFFASGPTVFFVFWCTQCSLNHPPGKSLVVLGQEIGVDAPHSSAPCSSSHSAKCDELWCADTGLTRASPYGRLGGSVTTCNIVSTLPLSVELRRLQSVSYPHFALFHLPQTYHGTVQLLCMFGGCVSNSFLRLCTPFTVSFS
jgi:hypothetical protein